MRAMYKRVKAIGGSTKVEPKSGCKKIKNIGITKHIERRKIPVNESRISPIFDRDKILAPIMMVANLAISDG